jgi:hypothetical protein
MRFWLEAYGKSVRVVAIFEQDVLVSLVGHFEHAK